jgi:hypothetical protein
MIFEMFFHRFVLNNQTKYKTKKRKEISYLTLNKTRHSSIIKLMKVMCYYSRIEEAKKKEREKINYARLVYIEEENQGKK